MKLVFANSATGRLICGLLLLLFCLTAKSSEISLHLGQEYWHYVETDEKNIELDKDMGRLNHIGITGLVAVNPHLHINVSIHRAEGALKYIGSTQSGKPLNTITDTRSHLYVLTGRYYVNGIPRNSSKNIYLGSGIQHQKWSREIRPTNHSLALHEYYRWLGPRLEAGYLHAFHPRAQLEFSTAMALLSGAMDIDLTKIPNAENSFGRPTVQLNKGYELSALLMLRWQLKPSIKLLASYQLGRRYFPASNEVSASNGNRSITLHEPKSNNNFHVLTIGLGYLF